VQRRESSQDRLKDGHIWVPKYQYDEDILDLYYRTGGRTELDPVVAKMSDDDLLDLMDTWDPASMPVDAWTDFDPETRH